MNTKRVQAAEGVILAALKMKNTAAGIAIALDSACLLQAPETAAELVTYRALELGAVDHRVSAACGNSGHPTWLRSRDDVRGCPWCRVAELETERHSTNEALSEAVERIAELEAAAVCPSVARLHGSKCALPVRHRGDHRDETKRHYWSDDYALQLPSPARQQEDPHDSPLHHDYALGRELPEVRVCPECETTFTPNSGVGAYCSAYCRNAADRHDQEDVDA